MEDINKWHHISTAPKNREILLFFSDVMIVGKWLSNRWIESQNYLTIAPTHWCELPENPKLM